MSKGMRWTERWFQRGLWAVAVVFAGFLVGLGSTLVGDLPKVERRLELDDFLDRGRAEQLRTQVRASQRAQQEAQSALEQARLQLQVARHDASAARGTFANWLATRRVTQQFDQDLELVARTRQLDTLAQAERQAEGSVERQEQAQLDARQAAARAQRDLAQLEEGAQKALAAEQRRVELRVFLYRLALTMPPLVLAGWLFRRHRHGTWWPFVWGFIGFALFTFFVELVPYLPSYGGYVRYVVGIVVTVLAGRQAVRAYERYRERAREAEARPEGERRDEVPYDTALARMAKGVCPGCERPIDLKTPGQDFCPHCGIGVFDQCVRCTTRKNAFARYCPACGTPAQAGGDAPPLSAVAPA